MVIGRKSYSKEEDKFNKIAEKSFLENLSEIKKNNDKPSKPFDNKRKFVKTEHKNENNKVEKGENSKVENNRGQNKGDNKNFSGKNFDKKTKININIFFFTFP